MLIALIISTVLCWCVCILLVGAVLLLGRAHAELTTYIHDLELRLSPVRTETLIGKPAPDFQLPTLDNKRTVTLAQLRGKPTLLLFLSPTCSHCHTALERFAPQLKVWQQKGGHLLGISSGDPREMARLAAQYAVSFPLVVQEQWQVSRQYGVPGTPWMVGITPEGNVTQASGLSSAEELDTLLKVTAAMEQDSTSYQPIAELSQL